MNNSDRKQTVVNSGAGTGKTTYMQNAIREYLKVEGNCEKDILGITFTNRAGYNMKKGLTEFPDVKISSMHKYLFPTARYKDIVPGDIYEEIILNSVNELNLKILGQKLKVAEIYKHISSWQTYCVLQLNKNLKVEDRNYKELRKYLTGGTQVTGYLKAKSKNEFEWDRLSSIIECVRNIISYVYNAGYVRFDDIILQGLYFKDHNLKYVLIDEFQDLSHIEYLAITTISKNAEYLILCDEYQGIYQWRNSSYIYNLKHFFQRFANTEVVNLGTNYRSSRKVSNLASKFTTRDAPKVYRDIEGELKVLSSGNYLQNILNQVNSVGEEEDIAILCQSNVMCNSVANFLKLNDIQNIDHKVRDYNSESDPVRVFLKWIAHLESPHSTPKLKALLADKHFTGDTDVNILEVLALLKGITAEQLQCEEYSLFNETKAELGYTYVVFDTESTGLDTEEDDIIQIAGTKLNHKLEVVDKFSVYINTEKDLTNSFPIHQISKEYLDKNSTDKKDALNSFMEFCNGCIGVGHNVGYDRDILNSNLSKMGLENNIHYYVDTCDLAMTILPGMPSYKLTELNEELNLGGSPNHNADFDVEATVLLLRHLVNINKPNKRIKYAREYYRVVMDKMTALHSEDLMETYKNIESQFVLADTSALFSELFKINLKMVLKQFNSLKRIVNFFLLNEVVDIESSKVTVCTIHQSKGLEFDNVVFLQSYNSSPINVGSEKTNIEYVITTRARNNFTLIKTCRNSNIEKAIIGMESSQIKQF